MIPEPTRSFRLLGRGIELLRRASGRQRPRTVPVVDRDLRLRVLDVHTAARDVVAVRLGRGPGDPAGSELPPWRPGAHLDLVLPSGRVRQYSLTGPPGERTEYRIAVRRIEPGGGGSREVHGLTPGTPVTVRGPREAFPLIQAPNYLFLAGGIGITPILAMVRAVAVTRADWRLVYVGRDRAGMPFLDELATLDPARVVVRPDDEHAGPPSGAELLGHAPGPGATGYLCGPPPMVAAVRAALDDPATDAAPPIPGLVALHTERFSAPPVTGGRPFTVELARSGARLAVPADRSLLDVLRTRVPEVAYSCSQGFCGTCRIGVLAGTVDHRDRVLTGGEREGSMTVCVSRAAGDRLVLDL